MQVNQRRLYRSADDRILAGVAGGVAAYFDVDPVIVRIIWFLSIFFTGTLTFWAYLVMVIVVPLEPSDWPPQSPWAPGGAPVGGAPVGYAANYSAPSGPTDQTAAPAGASAESGQGEAAGSQPAEAATPGANAAAPGAQSFTAPNQPGQWTANTAWDWRAQRRADRWQRRADRWERRSSGSGGLIFGLLLIVVGGLLAWHQIDPNVDLGLVWPLGVVALGVILIASSFRLGGRS
jgi:phage shock protein C